MGTQSTDKLETTNIGILFTVADEMWTINPGIFVSSQAAIAVESGQSGSTRQHSFRLFRWGVVLG